MAELQTMTENVFDSFLENLNHVIAEVQDGEAKERSIADFDFNAYWKKLGDVFKAVSHEATKLSIAYSRPPPPSVVEAQGLLGSAEKTVLTLIAVYSNLPKAAGLTLRKSLRTSVRTILESLKSLVETIRQYDSGSPQRLKNTGIVWEETGCFSKLPHDNKEAVLCEVEKVAPLVDDAYTELNDALNCDEDDDGLDEFLGFAGGEDSSSGGSNNKHSWSESDRNVIEFCLGLIKCSRSVLKKTKGSVAGNGRCDGVETITELDDLLEFVEKISPVADELASCVYPPLKRDVLHERVTELRNANRSLVNFLKKSHLTTEEDQKWVEFLNRANNHNFSKANSLLATT